jgi:hypothetical protein
MIKNLVVVCTIVAGLLVASVYGASAAGAPALTPTATPPGLRDGRRAMIYQIRRRMAITATPAPASLPQATGGCSIDWGLPVTYDNQKAIIACHRQLYPFNPATGRHEDGAGTGAPPLCPPAGSPWEIQFNTSNCWAINYGTPAALTATAPPAYP